MREPCARVARASTSSACPLTIARGSLLLLAGLKGRPIPTRIARVGVDLKSRADPEGARSANGNWFTSILNGRLVRRATSIPFVERLCCSHVAHEAVVAPRKVLVSVEWSLSGLLSDADCGQLQSYPVSSIQ